MLSFRRRNPFRELYSYMDEYITQSFEKEALLYHEFLLKKDSDSFNMIAMESAIIVKIIILILLIGCSAFFSASETALMTVSQIRMRTLAEEGNKRAARVLRLTEQPARMLSAILIGNNIANLFASSLTTSIIMELIGNRGVAIATGVLTLIVLIFGEITPKTMATIRAERMSMRVCRIIFVIMTILTPVIFVVNLLAGGVLRLFGVDPSKKKAGMTEREIRTVVDVGQEEGVIEEEEKEIINNLFDFGDDQASEIMIPRIDMSMINADAGLDEILEIFREEKHTRFPVYEEDSDHIVGILNVKDLLLCDPQTFSLREVMREPYYTYESKNNAELFMEMRELRIGIAIVLDEYGVTAGMVTLEDLLEEIVGEIRDEYDTDEEAPWHQISENEYLVDASYNLEDFCRDFDLSLESEDYDSLGGYLIGLTDRIPSAGEIFTSEDGTVFRVESRDGNRLDKILVITYQ